MKTAGKTWKELEKATMDRKQWKSLVSALCATSSRRDEDYPHPLIAAIWKPTSAQKIIRGLINPYSINMIKSYI